MTPLMQVGTATLLIALSYAVILAASTLAFIIVDRRYDIIPIKVRPEESEQEEPDVQESDDIQ